MDSPNSPMQKLHGLVDFHLFSPVSPSVGMKRESGGLTLTVCMLCAWDCAENYIFSLLF